VLRRGRLGVTINSTGLPSLRNPTYHSQQGGTLRRLFASNLMAVFTDQVKLGASLTQDLKDRKGWSPITRFRSARPKMAREVVETT